MSTKKRSPAEKIAPPDENSRKFSVIETPTWRLSRNSEEDESLRELIRSLTKNSTKRPDEEVDLPPAA